MEENEGSALLIIPEEVIYGKLFPYLQQNDVLRLRRTCKQIRNYADDFIRIHITHQEREINENDHTFSDFIQRDLPTSKLYLNNQGPEFFDNPDIPEFLELYSSKITHLRVKSFHGCVSEQENTFYCALTKLQHLDLEETDVTHRRYLHDQLSRAEKEKQEVPLWMSYFPPHFQNLKTLKLNKVTGTDPIRDPEYVSHMIQFCSQVEHLKQPYCTAEIEGVSATRHGPFGCVMECIRQKVANNQPISLKTYDLQYVDENGFWEMVYLEFVQLCYQHNIQLLNVDAALNGMVEAPFQNNYQQFAAPLVSLRNLHGNLFFTELPNLKKLVITSTSDSSVGDFLEDVEPQWPQLTSLDLTIDSDEVQGFEGLADQPVTALLDFLFSQVERPGLKELRICFAPEKDDEDADPLPCPRVASIAYSCPNISKLWLSNWLGTNKAISKFWKELSFLEEVTLEECKMLGNVAFVGEDRSDPTFLKLTNLKKFNLWGLDSMPKVTDLIFNLVFSRLRIKEFNIRSKTPVKSVTANGIRYLLGGNFNEHVERFPFTGWSLENVSQDEMNQLRLEFRSSYML